MAQIASINPAALMPLITPPNAQQTRQARRIYVGGIPATSSEEHIKSFFDDAMNRLLVSAGAANGSGIGSAVAVQVNHEKMFSFVEFRSHEEATTAMGLDGILMDGQFPLKISFIYFFSFIFFEFNHIRRPTDYKPPGTLAINPSLLAGADPNAALAAAAAITAGTAAVPDSPNKLFMGGLSLLLLALFCYSRSVISNPHIGYKIRREERKRCGRKREKRWGAAIIIRMVNHSY